MCEWLEILESKTWFLANQAFIIQIWSMALEVFKTADLNKEAQATACPTGIVPGSTLPVSSRKNNPNMQRESKGLVKC